MSVDPVAQSSPERPEVLLPAEGEPGDSDEINETIDHPAKVMRIGTMLKQLLAEVRSTDLDEASRQRLRAIYDTSVNEVGSTLSPDLRAELTRLASPFEQADTPSAVDIRRTLQCVASSGFSCSARLMTAATFSSS